jgi:multidrug efflux system outer membrane protein
MLRNLTLILLASTAVSACTLAPDYNRPSLPVASTWSTPAPEPTGSVTAADLDWRQVLVDPRLQGVVDLALKQNRDLRVAVLNIERARAQYRIQRSELFPSIDAGLSGSRGRTPASVSPVGVGGDTESYSATIGFTAYELDLFGRVRSLNAAALQNYFATRENSRAVRISLIAETANAWLTLAADQDRLTLAQSTLQTREESLRLVQQQVDGGVGSLTDLRNAQILSRDRALRRGDLHRPGGPGPQRPGAADRRRCLRRPVAPQAAWRTRGSWPTCRRACRPTCWSAVPTCWPPSMTCKAPTPISARPARPSSRASA